MGTRATLCLFASGRNRVDPTRQTLPRRNEYFPCSNLPVSLPGPGSPGPLDSPGVAAMAVGRDSADGVSRFRTVHHPRAADSAGGGRRRRRGGRRCRRRGPAGRRPGRTSATCPREDTRRRPLRARRPRNRDAHADLVRRVVRQHRVAVRRRVVRREQHHLPVRLLAGRPQPLRQRVHGRRDRLPVDLDRPARVDLHQDIVLLEILHRARMPLGDRPGCLVRSWAWGSPASCRAPWSPSP